MAHPGTMNATVYTEGERIYFEIEGRDQNEFAPIVVDRDQGTFHYITDNGNVSDHHRSRASARAAASKYRDNRNAQSQRKKPIDIVREIVVFRDDSHGADCVMLAQKVTRKKGHEGVGGESVVGTFPKNGHPITVAACKVAPLDEMLSIEAGTLRALLEERDALRKREREIRAAIVNVRDNLRPEIFVEVPSRYRFSFEDQVALENALTKPE